MEASTPFRYSLEQKLQNPSCSEPLIVNTHFTIQWQNLIAPFGPKARMLSICTASDATFFNKLNNLDCANFADKMSIFDIINDLAEIEKRVQDNSSDFVGYMDSVTELCNGIREIEKIARKITKMQLDEGIIAFHLLPFMAKKDDTVEVIIHGVKHVAVMTSQPNYGFGFGGAYFIFYYKVVDLVECPAWVDRGDVIHYYDGVKPIDELAVRPIDANALQFYKERGEKLVEMAKKPHYKFTPQYNILIVKESMFGNKVTDRVIEKPTRIIIDNKNPKKLDDKIYANYTGLLKISSRSSRRDPNNTVPEKDYMYALAFMIGYVPDIRSWCLCSYENLSEIVFSENAWDDLVLPERSKQVIRALVSKSNNKDEFTDIIQGKSGGTAICMEGEPGTGKTLTAEATAEQLHRPLIVISSGSLGTNPEVIEQNLKRELAIAEEWNAVVIINEADVFLSKRDSNDIQHNGVVSVFLTCLEYYHGVIFLTTNRMGNIDTAFKSRILLTLRFGKLPRDARQAIWVNLMRNAGINGDARKLSKYPINGRQIKNAIRIAKNLSDEKHSDDYTDRLWNVLAQVFTNDLTLVEKIKLRLP